VEKLINGTKIQTTGKKKIIGRALYWLRKATEVSGEEEKFIYRWIALEALSGFSVTTSSARRMLNDLLSCRLELDSANEVFELDKETINILGKSNIVGWRGRHPSINLANAIENKENCKVILSRAVLCIYEVRNSLFHQGLVAELLNGCSSLLRDLNNSLIRDILSI